MMDRFAMLFDETSNPAANIDQWQLQQQKTTDDRKGASSNESGLCWFLPFIIRIIIMIRISHLRPLFVGTEPFIDLLVKQLAKKQLISLKLTCVRHDGDQL